MQSGNGVENPVSASKSLVAAAERFCKVDRQFGPWPAELASWGHLSHALH